MGKPYAVIKAEKYHGQPPSRTTYEVGTINPRRGRRPVANGAIPSRRSRARGIARRPGRAYSYGPHGQGADWSAGGSSL